MIGILDSGLGGLTAAKNVAELLPSYDLLYLGDTARGPCGSKSNRVIIDDTLRSIRFLTGQGARIVIMACCSASSVAYASVAGQTGVPVLEVISPAAAFAVEASRNQKYGIIGTRTTIESRACEKKILQLCPEAKIYSNPAPLLTSLVEEGWIKKPETRMIIKKYLHPLKVRQIDTLVLACTHYSLIKHLVQKKIGKRVVLVDPSVTIAGHLARFLEKHPQIESQLPRNGISRFFVSDWTSHAAETARALFRKNIALEQVRLE